MYIALFIHIRAEYAHPDACVFMIYTLLRVFRTAPPIAKRAHKIVLAGSTDHYNSI